MMELLLTADPNKKAILEYFSNSRVLTCCEDGCCNGIVLLTISNDVYELKKILQ